MTTKFQNWRNIIIMVFIKNHYYFVTERETEQLKLSVIYRLYMIHKKDYFTDFM